MSPALVPRGRLVLPIALLALLGSTSSRAQPSDRERTSAAVPASALPLKVWIDTGGAIFDRASLQASLQRELGRPVALTEEAQAASVRVVFEGAARAEVRYTTPGGEQLSRSVDLPPDRGRSVQVVTWLTVNLVRDEASELLDALRARRKQEAELRAAEERAAADQAAADQAAAEKAAADKAAADRAAADQATVDAARKQAESAKKAAVPQAYLLRDPRLSFDVAVVTPISLIRDSPKRALKLQLALWHGDAGGIEGVSLSLGGLRVRRDLAGFASGLGAAIVGGNARGIVLSGGYAHVDGVLDGALIGGGAAWHRGRFARGLALAGGGVSTGDLTGLSLGGGFASARSLHGVALAGAVTAIRGPSKGLQLAGGVNVSASHRGLQLAGGVNTARDLDGFALAPLNIHRRVRGFQLGVVNVAEQVDGAAIGVVSYAKNGRLQPVLWTATDGSIHVALKSIVGWAFTQVGGGVDLRGASYSYDGGIGLHLELFGKLFLEPGIHYSGSNGTADASGPLDEHQLHYLAVLGYRAGDKLDLLAGAGLRHTFSGGSGPALAPELRAGIAFF